MHPSSAHFSCNVIGVNVKVKLTILQRVTLRRLLEVWCPSSKTQLADRQTDGQTDEEKAGKTNQDRVKREEEEKKEKERAAFHCSVASWERVAAGLWGDANTGGEDKVAEQREQMCGSEGNTHARARAHAHTHTHSLFQSIPIK